MSAKPALPFFEDQKQVATQLTVLSYGGGQDSDAILRKLAYDEGFRGIYAPGRLLVIMSDTGDEHRETYAHAEQVKNFCKLHDINFVFLTNDMGFHPDNWGSLLEQYRHKNPTIGSKAYPKTCTDNLKIKPIYNYLEKWLSKEYNLDFNGRKKTYHDYATLYPKIKVLVGIAKGEESRVADKEKETRVWWKKAIDVTYPLIDIGFDRQACQDYIKSVGHEVPLPSNCKRCPHMSLQELLWMYRFIRDDFDEWVIDEQNKLDHWSFKEENNLGVWGKWIKAENRPMTLLDALAEAEEKYGHWSDEQLWEYKMSHGHCVSSKY